MRVQPLLAADRCAWQNGMSAEFRAGQRWISDTETDLGLGSVLEAEHRRVTVLFPATGDTRIYATESAPLTRVVFAVGDTVKSRAGWSLAVLQIEEDRGLLCYVGKRADNGEEASIIETEIDDLLQFRTPRERLFAGLIEGVRWYGLRRAVFEHRRRLAHSSVRGLAGARVSVLPHQIHVAVAALEREYPRLLLADEVGLGKTIEAGLIVHARLVQGRDHRVLIVVPAPLLHQWLVEMLRKFNLVFSIMDAERFIEVAETAPDGNPFLTEQLVLCPLDDMVAEEGMGDAAIAAGFDMLVADEAHRLDWSPAATSPGYEIVESLAEVTPSVLLLTATPEQLGQDGHFARLRLLDPDRFGDLARYREEEAGYAPVAAIADRLSRDEALDEAAVTHLEELFGAPFSDTERRTLASSATLSMSDLGTTLVERLVDRHGTGRVMFRNTRAAVGGFPGRVLHRHELDDDAHDTLVAWLIEFLSGHAPEKILLICKHRETVQELGESLRVAGIANARFHEGLSIVERDRAAAYFADPDESCRLLLCSEIGSEGRNFQFLHRLVMIELPGSPDLLEQRIGRLDRIGQTHVVQVHVPCVTGSADHTLLRWYDEGLNAFEKIGRTGAAVEHALGDEISTLVDRASSGLLEESDLDKLIGDTQTLSRRLDSELEAGRDRLLELNSNRPERVQAQLDELARLDRDYRLQDFMEAVFDRFGVEVIEQRDHWIIQPGDHMQVATFPHLPEDGMSITFDRATALAREELTYFSWDHPMVLAAMDLVLDEGFGQADAQVISLLELPDGLALIEASHVLDCPAPASLGVERYLSADLETRFIGTDGQDWTATLDGIDIDSAKQRHDRSRLRQVVLKSRKPIEILIQRLSKHADARVPALVDDAREAIDAEFTEARDRLIALARVNPAVHDDEVVQLDQRQAALLEALGGTRARPVQVRVLFNTHGRA